MIDGMTKCTECDQDVYAIALEQTARLSLLSGQLDLLYKAALELVERHEQGVGGFAGAEVLHLRKVLDYVGDVNQREANLSGPPISKPIARVLVHRRRQVGRVIECTTDCPACLVAQEKKDKL